MKLHVALHDIDSLQSISNNNFETYSEKILSSRMKATFSYLS